MKKPTGQCETMDQRIKRKTKLYAELAARHGAEAVISMLLALIEELRQPEARR